jgi:hypothetical protein
VQKETLWGKHKKILFFEEIFCILGEKRGFQLSGLLGLLLAYMCFGFFSHIVWKSFYKRRGGEKGFSYCENKRLTFFIEDSTFCKLFINSFWRKWFSQQTSRRLYFLLFLLREGEGEWTAMMSFLSRLLSFEKETQNRLLGAPVSGKPSFLALFFPKRKALLLFKNYWRKTKAIRLLFKKLPSFKKRSLEGGSYIS